jgi:simple sugar transport system permease protein
MSQITGTPPRSSTSALIAVQVVIRYLIIFLIALVLFGMILVTAGKNPLAAINDTLSFTLGSTFGFSEVIVKMIPLIFTAIAVALPSRVVLINVGAEGQLYMGAWLAAWGALTFTDLPAWALLPLMVLLGMIGGSLWALIPAFLRARGLVNETITTLLMNYVAPSIVTFFIYGPWRSRGDALFPQTADFVPAARLPAFFSTCVHFGLILALILLVLYWFIMKYTRWGLEMRAIGGNPQAARRNGIPLTTYIIVIMCLGGAFAGLAGMSEISGIHGRLRPGFSPGFGYMGFLISWLSGGNPIGILIMSFVAALISAGADILQINQGLPYAVVNLLLAITLFVVLARPTILKGKKA